MHTVIGAGAASGGTLDASNLLKPALSSGKLRCIGATTFEEYRSHLERDRALARRFQKVEVLEPSLEDSDADPARACARTTRSSTASPTRDEAIEAAATLAQRHLHDRKLPDKAIDLLDEAGADTKLSDGDGASVDGRPHRSSRRSHGADPAAPGELAATRRRSRSRQPT